MYFDFTLEIPNVPGKITRIARTTATYIYYEYDRSYDAKRKFNIPRRAVIGKQAKDDSSRMYPNENFLKFFPSVQLPESNWTAKRSCCLKIGSFLIISMIIEKYGIDSMIRGIIGSRDGGLFLDLATYSIVCEDNAGQYYPNYAYNHPLFTDSMNIYSDSKVSSFLSSVTDNQNAQFLNEWNSTHDHREKIYISYDSTNKNCQAGNIEMVEYGHPKTDAGLPIFNYSVAYDRTNSIPLFYEEYPGSIVDVSQLQYMLEKAYAYGYRKVGFILDRGYFSKDNIHYMDSCGYDFVIMMKGMATLASELVLQNKGQFEESRKNFIRHYHVYGTTIARRLYTDDDRQRYFHLYHSSKKAADEIRELETKIQRMASTMDKAKGRKVVFPKGFSHYYNLQHDSSGVFLFYTEKEAAIERAIHLCGYFVIVTSSKMDASQALDLYKSRDISEKLFRGDKSYLGNKSLRVQSGESASAKIFVEFVALIVRNRIYTLLSEATRNMDRRPNYMTVPAALKELDKIELARQFDGIYRLDHAITATQKDILKAFGLDVEYVRNKASGLGEKLAQIAKDVTAKEDAQWQE
jgi:transposase